MKVILWRLKRFCGILILLLAAGCADPLGPISGGQVTGEVASVPLSAELVGQADTVVVETNPDEPLSVTTWAVASNSSAYISSSSVDKDWVRNVLANPKVRIKIDDLIYPVTAKEVENEEDKDRIMASYVDKYDSAESMLGGGKPIFFKLTN